MYLKAVYTMTAVGLLVLLVGAFWIVSPDLVFAAQTTGSGSDTSPIRDIGDLATRIISIINGVVVPLILAIAFLVFIWGVFRFFIAGGEEAKTEGKNLIIYGLIGFFVILSVWGLVNVLLATFELNDSTPTLPKAPFQ